jgi:hypothetical protein
MICENARRELGPSVGFPLVACQGGEKCDSWRSAVHLLEEIGDEIGLMSMVEGCNREFELIRELKT